MADEDKNIPVSAVVLLPHKNTGDVNSKIMLTAIVSVSIAAVLVVILHVYARCVLRRQSHARRGRAFIQQLGLATSQFHNSSSCPAPKPGLDPAVIAALPVFPFKEGDSRHGDQGGGNRECAVCLSVLVGGETVRFLPNCTHTFHVGCIDRWLSSHPTCPICRTEAEPPVEGTSDAAAAAAAKAVGGSTSRLSSFRRMLSRERSSRRSAQACGQEDDGLADDIERQ